MSGDDATFLMWGTLVSLSLTWNSSALAGDDLFLSSMLDLFAPNVPNPLLLDCYDWVSPSVASPSTRASICSLWRPPPPLAFWGYAAALLGVMAGRPGSPRSDGER